MSKVMLSTADHELGLAQAGAATKLAQIHANESGKAVTVRHAVTDKVIRTVKPAKVKAKAKAKAKPTAKAKAKPAKAAADRKPRGMVVTILKLASRPNGVSPAELNKVTEWTGAPWKWLFSNPKKTGYCDRWGYTFKVTKNDEGETRYSVKAR